MEQGIRETDRLNARVRSIGASLAQIFREAEAAGESPVAAARKRARRVLRQNGG